jgi:transposase
MIRGGGFMPAPLPIELRSRIVAAYEDGEGSHSGLAKVFRVGRASVSRYLGLASEGSLAPKRTQNPGPKPQLSPDDLILLRQLSTEFSDYFDHEIAELFCERTGLSVSARTINRAFHKLNITRKKNSRRRTTKQPKNTRKEEGAKRVATGANNSSSKNARPTKARHSQR